MNKIQEPLKIYYCGHEECESGHLFGPATRSHYLMHFILKGRGSYQVGNKTYVVEEGNAFLIRPQELTIYKADIEVPWEYVWVAFDGSEADRLLEEYNMVGEQYICKQRKKYGWDDYLMRLFHCYIESGNKKEELIGWFYLIFSSIEKENKEKNDVDMDYYRKAERYISHNYGYNIHITDIAKHVGIDRTYLFKIFKKYKGIAPKKYLTIYRIHAAKDMLKNTNLNVTEIALSCGFIDSSVFCKNFFKEVGQSPLQYKKN